MPLEASADKVIEFLPLIRDYNVWIDGGWGVDALLTIQTRPHRDLDLIVCSKDLPALKAHLERSSFEKLPDEGCVYLAPSGLKVDLHAVEFDDAGWGSFDLGDGREWPMPPSAFQGEGIIAGQKVRCLSAEAQVHCHGQGYLPMEKDIADMKALQAKFSLVLPLSLGIRFKSNRAEPNTH